MWRPDSAAVVSIISDDGCRAAIKIADSLLKPGDQDGSAELPIRDQGSPRGVGATRLCPPLPLWALLGYSHCSLIARWICLLRLLAGGVRYDR